MKTFGPVSIFLTIYMVAISPPGSFVVFADRAKTCPAVYSEIRRLADRQLLVLQQCKPIEQKYSVLFSHQFHVEYCDSSRVFHNHKDI